MSARVAREAEANERKMKEAHDLLESRKTLFPPWTLKKLIKEAIDTPSILWLEPVISLDRVNSVDSQFDMPLTRKAFIFMLSLILLMSLILTRRFMGSLLNSI